MTWHVEPEREPDVDAVRVILEDAFGREEEADLVERLRHSDAWIPELALVARDGTDPTGCGDRVCGPDPHVRRRATGAGARTGRRRAGMAGTRGRVGPRS